MAIDFYTTLSLFETKKTWSIIKIDLKIVTGYKIINTTYFTLPKHKIWDLKSVTSLEPEANLILKLFVWENMFILQRVVWSRRYGSWMFGFFEVDTASVVEGVWHYLKYA